MNYYLYYIISGIVLLLCFVYIAYARRRVLVQQQQAAAEGLTIEYFLRQPQQTLEELLNDPDWFLHLRKKLEPEQILAFTQCVLYEGWKEKAVQLAEWIFWRTVTTYKNIMPNTYSCYLVLTSQSLHYLYYDVGNNCLEHLILPRQELQSVQVAPVQDLAVIEKLRRQNQTSFTGKGLYKLLLKAGNTETAFIYRDYMYLDSIDYRRMVQAQAMAQHFDLEIRKL